MKRIRIKLILARRYMCVCVCAITTHHPFSVSRPHHNHHQRFSQHILALTHYHHTYIHAHNQSFTPPSQDVGLYLSLLIWMAIRVRLVSVFEKRARCSANFSNLKCPTKRMHFNFTTIE